MIKADPASVVQVAVVRFYTLILLLLMD